MSEHMSPLDQLYILNAELMKHGDKFTSPIVTVGGQAVHYWVVWYKDIYSEHFGNTIRPRRQFRVNV